LLGDRSRRQVFADTEHADLPLWCKLRRNQLAKTNLVSCMIKKARLLGLLIIATIHCGVSYAEEGKHHLPHDHISIVVGKAYEETADGHHEDGHLFGIAYGRQFSELWGWGASFEREAFGENDQKRLGVLSVFGSYYPTESLRLIAGGGVEFREQGDPDKALFRLGAGYSFALGERLTLTPEAVVDFIAGGTTVYVIAMSLGYGF